MRVQQATNISDCGDLPIILYGNVTETTTKSSERRFSVVCDQGYSTIGSTAIICETNGNWSKPALCLPLSCGNISAPTNGHILSITDMVYGGKVTVRCNEGYIVNGSEKVNCLSSGTWDELPSCSKLVLGLPVYYGTSFITGFMAGYLSHSVTLLIACREQIAVINVSIPALNIFNKQHQLTNGALTLTYGVPIFPTVSGKISNNSAFITADRPIALFAGRLANIGSADGSLVKPETSLGTDYIISGFPAPVGYEEFLVVGTVDSTTITIFIHSATENITLNRMETYMLTGVNLSGTMISSSAPVYVLSGNKCAVISDGTCDYIDEEMPSLSSLGTHHVVSFMAPRPDFTVSIAVPYDNTSFTIYNAAGTSVETISSMMKTAVIFRSYTGFQSISIVSTQPVLVTQYGHGTAGTSGDPSMMTIPDVSHFGNQYDFVVPNDFISTVVVVINSSYSITDILRDGVAFSPTQTISVSITGYGNYVVLYSNVLPGYHWLAHKSKPSASFGAWIYGRRISDEYAWSLGHT